MTCCRAERCSGRTYAVHGGVRCGCAAPALAIHYPALVHALRSSSSPLLRRCFQGVTACQGAISRRAHDGAPSLRVRGTPARMAARRAGPANTLPIWSDVEVVTAVRVTVFTVRLAGAAGAALHRRHTRHWVTAPNRLSCKSVPRGTRPRSNSAARSSRLAGHVSRPGERNVCPVSFSHRTPSA